MPRITENPPIIGYGKLDLAGIVDMRRDTHHKWYLLHTKGRQERQLAFDLQEMGVPYFLPMLYDWDNPQAASVMFSSYMFLYGSIYDRYNALRTQRVVTTIDIPDQQGTHHELVQLYRAMVSGAPVQVVARVSKGDECKVVAGPMVGVCGRVEALDRAEVWVFLSIRTVGQSVLLKVRREHLSVVHGVADAAA